MSFGRAVVIATLLALAIILTVAIGGSLFTWRNGQ